MGTFRPPKGDGVAECNVRPNRNVTFSVGGWNRNVKTQHRGHHPKPADGTRKVGYGIPGGVVG